MSRSSVSKGPASTSDPLSRPTDKKPGKDDTEAPADDVDPLDAFMAGMEGELKEDLSLTGTGVKRKYEEYSTGVEKAIGSKDFDQRVKDLSTTKGSVSHER